jgi:hypothetical protein
MEQTFYFLDQLGFFEVTTSIHDGNVVAMNGSHNGTSATSAEAEASITAPEAGLQGEENDSGHPSSDGRHALFKAIGKGINNSAQFLGITLAVHLDMSGSLGDIIEKLVEGIANGRVLDRVAPSGSDAHTLVRPELELVSKISGTSSLLISSQSFLSSKCSVKLKNQFMGMGLPTTTLALSEHMS